MNDHCQSLALSDPDNGLFQKKCNHDPVEISSECYKLNEFLLTSKLPVANSYLRKRGHNVYVPAGK